MGIIKEKLLANAKPLSIAQSEYDKVEILKGFCNALSLMNNQSIYVLDYSKQEFFHVSPHPLFLCGYTVNEVLEMGFDYYEKVVAPENVEMMLEVCQTGWQFFSEAFSEKITQANMSYDIYLHHKNGAKTLINHKFAPLCLTKEGDVWLVIGVVSHSPRKKAGNVVYSKNNRAEYYTYDFRKKQILPHHLPKLTKREEEISLLIMRGYTMEEIAEQLKISPNTAKNHRTNIEKKLNTNNLFDTITTFY